MNNDFKMIHFAEDGLSLDVRVDAERETVWLTQAEMAELFGVDRTRITRHISSIIVNHEMEEQSNVRKAHFTHASRPISLYSLDMILAVGYRINSKRGVIFRRWANMVLKQYLMDGYVIDRKRLSILNRTVEVQRTLLSHYAEGAGADANEVIAVLDRFSSALNMLDDYDHQRLVKPKNNGENVVYLEERECLDLIHKTSFNQRGDLFGRERDKGLLKGILDQIAQCVFDTEIYPSIEEKAANLLYFLVKDHIFIDGNKRIGALLYLAFLHKNKMLMKDDGSLRVVNDGLAALTILIAESKPEEKEIMIAVTMNMTGK